VSPDQLERKVVVDLGLGSNDDLVLNQSDVGFIICGDSHCVVLDVHGFCFSSHKFEVVAAKLGESWLDGDEQLFVGYGTRNYTTNCRNVLIEMFDLSFISRW